MAAQSPAFQPFSPDRLCELDDGARERSLTGSSSHCGSGSVPSDLCYRPAIVAGHASVYRAFVMAGQLWTLPSDSWKHDAALRLEITLTAFRAMRWTRFAVPMYAGRRVSGGLSCFDGPGRVDGPLTVVLNSAL